MKATCPVTSPLFTPHAVHLSLANHVHHFIALQRSPCRLEGKEAHPWLDQPFDKAMVLLDQVIYLSLKFRLK